MARELSKQYDPKEVEERIYKMWLNGRYFHAKCEENKPTYTIVIPPPNITGQLHMGHALDNTLQDILIRFKRMQGYDTLWVPGTDHASIATEAKIVEKMRQEGLTKEDVGRDGFVERAWEWKKQYGGRIIEQLKKRGLFTGAKELLTGAPTATPQFRTPRLNMRSRQGIFGICATRLRTAAAIWSLQLPAPRPCSAIPPLR